MPLYTYRCPKCNKEKEELKAIRDFQRPLCRDCSSPVPRRFVYMERVFGSTGKPVFKGKGFYETDYKKKSDK